MSDWLHILLTPEGLIALLTLTLLEIVLGIDNVVFIAVVCGKLPEHQRVKAGRTGILMAVVTRVLLLLAITWLIRLHEIKLFTIFPNTESLKHAVSWKDIVLICGGLFLIAKATTEIHGKIEGGHMPGDPTAPAARTAKFGAVVVQIMLIDIVFSLDSVITAAGMSGHIPVMVAAVLISALVMSSMAGPIMRFVEKHPTIKVLALSFLVLIGMMLVAEGFDRHIPKGYIYFSMAFSLGVEVLNMRMRSKSAKRAAAGRAHHPPPPHV